MKQLSKKQKKIIDFAAEAVIYLVILFAALFFVPRYIIHKVTVEGPSMESTLSDGDHVLGEKLSVRFGNLKRYDVIYFSKNVGGVEETYIKRIIGLPGDTVAIKDSIIYINGAPASEHFALEGDVDRVGATGEVTLGADEYFVMGDNRNNSADSRTSMLGIIKNSDIGGRAIFRIWPLSKFGSIR